MNLSKYLESMRNLPDRFSNLAFWRGVRKLRDKLVDTFGHIGDWGNGIENLLRNFNRSFGHDYFPRSTVELSSEELKKISIVTVESSDSNGTFSTGYIKVASGDLHIKEISGYDNTISLGRCGARLEVELSDHTHTMLPLGVYVENYKYWNDPREFTFKLHFYCNDNYDSYFPVNSRLSITYAKIIFDCDALQLSVAI